MKSKVYLTLIIAIIVLFVSSSGCKHDPVELELSQNINEGDTTGNGGGGGGGTVTDPCHPDTVYFTNTILPLLISNCAQPGCHNTISQQDDIILDSYNAIMSSDVVQAFDLGDSEMWEVITETDPDKIMPPPPNNPLSNEQINLIATWINQGAQNNSCFECDTTNVTYSLTIKPITDLKCKGCHSGANPTGNISIVTHADLYTLAMSGQLSGVINKQGTYPLMPPSGGPLPDCEIDQIMIWINDGALNN
ncbi:MAG: hypothetical protein HKN22_00565 [Bacteroidia bacterium]|nr:hypothetical protein [Bacteroidia bacterium]